MKKILFPLTLLVFLFLLYSCEESLFSEEEIALENDVNDHEIQSRSIKPVLSCSGDGFKKDTIDLSGKEMPIYIEDGDFAGLLECINFGEELCKGSCSGSECKITNLVASINSDVYFPPQGQKRLAYRNENAPPKDPSKVAASFRAVCKCK